MKFNKVNFCLFLTLVQYGRVQARVSLNGVHELEQKDFIYGFDFTDVPSTDPLPNTTSTTCGGALLGDQGWISYKKDDVYSLKELCLWTIRTPSHSALYVIVGSRPKPASEGTIAVYSVTSAGIRRVIELGGAHGDQTVSVNSSVALVRFYSDNNSNNQGFTVSFQGVGPIDDTIDYYEDFNQVASYQSQNVMHPVDGLYHNRELSTFVFSRLTGTFNTLYFTIYSLDLEKNNSTGICIDKLHVYLSYVNNRNLYPISPETGICEEGKFPVLHSQDIASLILVLATDGQEQGRGFRLSWEQHVGKYNL